MVRHCPHCHWCELSPVFLVSVFSHSDLVDLGLSEQVAEGEYPVGESRPCPIGSSQLEAGAPCGNAAEFIASSGPHADHLLQSFLMVLGSEGDVSCVEGQSWRIWVASTGSLSSQSFHLDPVFSYVGCL